MATMEAYQNEAVLDEKFQNFNGPDDDDDIFNDDGDFISDLEDFDDFQDFDEDGDDF